MRWISSGKDEFFEELRLKFWARILGKHNLFRYVSWAIFVVRGMVSMSQAILEWRGMTSLQLMILDLTWLPLPLTKLKLQRQELRCAQHNTFRLPAGSGCLLSRGVLGSRQDDTIPEVVSSDFLSYPLRHPIFLCDMGKTAIFRGLASNWPLFCVAWDKIACQRGTGAPAFKSAPLPGTHCNRFPEVSQNRLFCVVSWASQ